VAFCSAREAAEEAIVASFGSPVRARDGEPMATFVLVHPAWFGSWCWNKLILLLRTDGHVVCAPTPTGLGERVHLAGPGVGLATHVDDV
jgi:hypothetical protein